MEEFDRRVEAMAVAFERLTDDEQPAALRSARQALRRLHEQARRNLVCRGMRTVAGVARSMIQEAFGGVSLDDSWLEGTSAATDDHLTDALFDALAYTEPATSAVSDVTGGAATVHSSDWLLANDQHEPEAHTGMQARASAKRAHECRVCGMRYGSKRRLNCHRKTHARAGERACTLCGRTLTSAKAYARHLRLRHKRARSQAKPPASSGCLILDTCSGASAQVAPLEASGQRVSSEARRCPHCPFASRYRQNVARHVRRVHAASAPPPAPLRCDECGQAAASRWHLREHALFAHSTERPHACAVCPKRFVSARELRRHALCHSGERPHACPRCDRRFTTAAHVKRHRLTVHRSPPPSATARTHLHVHDSV